MDRSQRLNRTSRPTAERSLRGNSRATVPDSRRTIPARGQPGTSNAPALDQESLGPLINRSPGLYASYDPTAPYETLSPMHRQLRDFQHISALTQTAVDDSNARMWARLNGQVAHEVRNSSNLEPEAILRADGMYNHPHVDFNPHQQDTPVDLGPIMPQSSMYNELYFPDLPALPLDIPEEWFVFDDSTLGVNEFAQMPQMEANPGLLLEDFDAFNNFHQLEDYSQDTLSTFAPFETTRAQGDGFQDSNPRQTRPSYSANPR